MTNQDDREQQQAELLWKYIEELKKADNPEDVQFVAITSGECGEVVGVMETAAEAYAVALAGAAPNCRREAVRQRLQAAIVDAGPAAATAPATAARAAQRVQAPAWLTAFLRGRSTGWAVAAAALIALIWAVSPRLPSDGLAPGLDHAQTIQGMPALIAGRLEPEKASAVWEHMRRCRHCFQIYEAQWRAAQTKPQRTGENTPATSGYGPRFAAWRAGP
jgi:hypothetical protein